MSEQNKAVQVTEAHVGWAASAAQHLCAEADRPAAVRLLADAFARFEAKIVQQAEAERRNLISHATRGCTLQLMEVDRVLGQSESGGA